MSTDGILVKGVLLAAAGLAITAAIIAVAPYLAVVILIYLAYKYGDEDEDSTSERDDK